MGKATTFNRRVVVYCCLLLAGMLLAGSAVSWAADTVCARVKIEIKQELTLERQAFDAHMRINNGLANISLEKVDVEVSFADKDGNPVLASSDPDNTEALFFIRLDSTENIDIDNGPGTVPASTTADIHWLIIPAPGSSNGLESGTLYYVGAKLTYTIGGEEKVTEVTPDYIFVKPMPEITLDYFLPSDVYGDDPLTEGTVEPIVPFSLGVRVRNSGHGVARKLKIESAQPKITENEQGLLIGFAIEGSEVNGQPATDSLLVDFGDIAPDSSAMARWIMTCTLSGKFVSFTADFSHSDELGGELTSLIQAVNPHFLVRDVLVDLPGRDAVRDFLAKDGSVYRIYESEVTGLADPAAGDPEVNDQSQTAVLTGTGDTLSLQTAVTAGYMYVQLTDPFGGQKIIKEVVRSDGKIIKPANAWLSHSRVRDNPWQHHFNLFDVNSPGTYTLRFEDTSAVPLPPAMQYIADQTVLEDEQVSFIVEAGDPNGTVPALSAAPLPVGAVFVDKGDGTGVFDWTPAEGQAGVYQIIYRASDGALEATRRATIAVKGFIDTDSDDIDDDWENQHFGGLDRDGSGDYDRDGISDLEEFLAETDPAERADIVVRLSADNMNPSVGDELVLTVTATNNGPRDATGVEIVDLLPDGLIYKSDDPSGSYDSVSGIWDVGNLPDLAPGHTATLNITAEVTRSGKILNVAALTDADLYDPDRSNNSAALILNGGSQSDLAISQASDNLTPEIGDTITVALTVANNGIDDATTVEIEALLPNGLSYVSSPASQGNYDQTNGIWVVGDLASGAGAELQLTLTADTIDESILTAAISGSGQPDPDPTNNRSSIIINQDPGIHPYIADLAIHKLVNHSAVDVGGQAVFTLLVRNNGPDDAGNIGIKDLLPTGLDFQSAIPSQGTYDDQSEIWQVGIIPAASYVIMDIVADVTQSGALINTASVGNLNEYDPDNGNDSGSATVSGLAADISVDNTVDTDTAYVSDPVVFSITVTNNGPNDAEGVQILDQLPTGLSHQSSVTTQGTYDPDTGVWEIGNLSNGATVTLQITAVVEQSGEITNTATRTASSPTDINADNNSNEATVTGYAPPVVSDIPGQTIDEGQLFLTIDLDDYVEDADNADAEIDWTYSGEIELSVDIDDGTHVAAIIIPHPDWYGSETITFKATDPTQLSDSSAAVFTVRNVNDPPVARVDTYDVDEDQILTMPAPGVLGNDSDIDSINVTAVLVEDVKSGTLILSSDGSFSYEPNGNFHGNDSFSYKANDGIEDSSVVTATIVVKPVNDAPVANAGGPYASNEGTSIAFDASSSSDIDNDELRYRWDFNSDGLWDTEYSTEPIATHTWYDDDTGTVVVEVSDGNLIDTATASVTVNNVAPTVEAGSDATIDEGGTFTSIGSFIDPGADDWTATVDYGDGSGAQPLALNPDKSFALSHIYAENAIYTVTVTISDDDGDSGSDTATVTVNNVAPTAEAGLSATINEGGTFTSSGSFTDPGDDTWTATVNYGDGSGAQALALNADKSFALSHTYAENATYTVTVTISDDDGDSGSDTTTVTVNNVAPTAEAGLNATINEGGTFTSSGSFTDPGDDTWTATVDYGDGSGAQTLALNPDKIFALSHTYAENGIYTVTVTISDDDGDSDSDTVIVTVNNVAPTVAAGENRQTAEGTLITFAGSYTDPGADTHTIEWNFGDDSPPITDSLTPSHRYAENGVYTVTLTVTDDDGGVGTDTLTVTVDNVAPSVAAGDDLAAVEGDEVAFSGTFSDPGTDTWTATVDFGDDTGVEPLSLDSDKRYDISHTYGDNGTYTVTVTVTDDDGGTGIGTLNVVVDNAVPVVTGPTTNSPSNGEIELTAAFADAGWLDTHTGMCEFGDDTAAVGADIDAEHEKPDATGTLTAAHTYTEEGLFTVSVTVIDDDGAGSTPIDIDVLIDKTTPVISVFEPQAGYYRNTDEIMVDVAVEDPESGGVSSGLDAAGVVVILDGREIKADELLDLSELADGFHTLYVAASDYAGNSAEQEVSFEVGPVPALVHIHPHNWNLKWLDPFDIQHGHHSKDTVKAEISLENAEVETVIPTEKAARLKIGDGYGDFVVVDVVAAQSGAKHGKEKVASLTLKYVGIDEMDILAFSGNTVLDFYSVNAGDTIAIDIGQVGYLDRHTVLSSYQSDPPLLSAADIIPETVLLNQQVPIIEGSARLMIKDAAALVQSGVIAELPYRVVKENKHHIWLANVGQPQQMTLEVGIQTIFADEPYPVNWQDWFSLDDDGRLQMMRIHVSGKDNLLKVLHHNLQAEARIYLDGDLALTILPETKLVVMEALFNRFDVMSTLSRDDLERGGDWLVTAHNGARLKGKHPRKHIRVSDIGHPQKAKLVIGETVVFDDQPFPIKWSERYLIVDGQRQDLSIRTHGARGKNPHLSINCKKLTREVRLYLDDLLVLLISPPPEIGMSITGELELDGDPSTFDGSFRGSDQVELKGKLPKDVDPVKRYQRINTSGEPTLQIGDRFGGFELVGLTEDYDDFRISLLTFRFDGWRPEEVGVYRDSRRKHLIKSFQAAPGDVFTVDVGDVESDKVYLAVGKKHRGIHLAGRSVAQIGDRYHSCAIIDTARIPLGPPHYIDLTLGYMGDAESVTITAYDGKWHDVLGTYEVDPAISQDFIIDGSEQRNGHIGHNLVLEYGSASLSSPDEPEPEKDSPGEGFKNGKENFIHLLKQYLLKALSTQRGQ